MSAEGQEAVRLRVARAERRVVAIGVLATSGAVLLAVFVWRRLNGLYARQQEATGRAQIAISRRDELLGVVAHDLRSPLNAIALRASLMCEDMPDAERRESARAIQRIVQRMDELISGLVDSAAIESGHLQVFKDRASSSASAAPATSSASTSATPGPASPRSFATACSNAISAGIVAAEPASDSTSRVPSSKPTAAPSTSQLPRARAPSFA